MYWPNPRNTVSDFRRMMLWVVSGLLVVVGSFDVWYFLRGTWIVIRSLLREPMRDVVGEQVIYGRVLPHDLDHMGHMNNSRYLRECDFARFAYYTHNRMYKAFRALRATVVVGASTIRYRRSLALWEAFEVRSRIVAWDEKSFYVEQRFVSKSDGFVSAVMLCRQNVIRSTPEKILEFLCKKKVECPDIPEDLQHWIKYISASSQALRAESGLEEKTK
ncbi:protein THEM6 isoform X1 [Electrophorus electricus]|uniref:Protein THEM6 n=1 Tax=Electrophorus electricus TaxID=8005 RepID=A0AAY5EQU1_ELEEL|nr:protein THEM6 isoform X1 [Electrophorus electricus]